jgi:hypothetical protein
MCRLVWYNVPVFPSARGESGGTFTFTCSPNSLQHSHPRACFSTTHVTEVHLATATMVSLVNTVRAAIRDRHKKITVSEP